MYRRPRLLPLLLLFSLLTGLLFCTCALADPVSGRVSWVYDGDTILVDGVGKVRLLGIDTPEKEASPRDAYYQKQEGVAPVTLRRIAREALSFNRQESQNRRVRLEFDSEKTDSYGRTLAYVILPDGRSLNRLLLERGLAAVYRRFDFRHKADYLQAEKSARDRQLGLWHK